MDGRVGNRKVHFPSHLCLIFMGDGRHGSLRRGGRDFCLLKLGLPGSVVGTTPLLADRGCVG